MSTDQDAEAAPGTAVDVYVGVGSNIEPERELVAGVDALEAAFGALEASSVYRSPALGFEGDDFLNVVVRFTTSLDADAVEARLDVIENDGRSELNSGRFAPRALDCDLLIYGLRIDASRRLPRDDIVRYPFVLGPLAEIAPQLRNPLDGVTIAEHWARRRDAVELARVCRIDALRLPADAASAVDGEDLAGDVSRVSSEI
jgi:2-amino-4-hydroxy-6-hydroxymethyldihydropteridine diphosphokinase